MVRVAGLREQAFGAELPQDPPADGLAPLTQLQRIAQRTEQLVAQQYACWNESILPALTAAGIRIHREAEPRQPRTASRSTSIFRQAVFPVLTPMAIDPSHPSPRFHNRGLYLAAMLKRVSGIGPERLFAVVLVPQVLPRFVSVEPDDKQNFVLLEDMIACRLPELFGGYDIVDHATFRLTRDMDINLLEQEADDMLRSIESRLRARQRTEAVRLEISAEHEPRRCWKCSSSEEEIHCETNFSAGRLQRGLFDPRPARHDVRCIELVQKVDRSDLREPPFVPRQPPGLRRRRRPVRRDRRPRHPAAPSRSIRSARSSTSSRRRPATRTCWPSSRRSTAPAATARSSGR